MNAKGFAKYAAEIEEGLKPLYMSRKCLKKHLKEIAKETLQVVQKFYEDNS